MDLNQSSSQSEEKFACVVFAFEPTVNEELQLEVGNIIKILKEIDGFWDYGQNLLNGRKGQFPKDFVTPIEVPVMKDGESLLFALDTFYPEVKDDLPFKKGHVIVMVRKVDDSWGYGRCDNRTGIFPLNYTQPLITSQSQPSVPECSDISSVICKVEATMPLTAQIEGELTFRVGDIISITEIMPDNWARGELHGSSGIFPLSFTTYLNAFKKNGLEDEPTLVSQSGKNSWKKNLSPSIDNSSFPFHSTTLNPLQHNTVKLSNGPSAFSPQGTLNEATSGISLAAGKGENRTYGQVIAEYSYQGRNSDELSFEQGNVIDVIEKKSDMWLYGKLNNSCGYIPRNYVSDLPPDHKKPTQSSENNLRAQFQNISKQRTNVTVERQQHAKQALVNVLRKHVDVRLVVEDFQAATDFELSLKLGDTVRVLQEISNEWCEVKNSSDKIGFAPSSCLQRVVTNPSYQHKGSSAIPKTNSPISQAIQESDNLQGNISTRKETIAADSGISAPIDKRTSQSSYSSITFQGNIGDASSGVYHMNRSQSSSQLKAKANTKPINRSESMHGKLYSMEQKNPASKKPASQGGDTKIKSSIHQRQGVLSEIKSNSTSSQRTMKSNRSKIFETDSISTASHDSTQSGSTSSGSINKGNTSDTGRSSQNRTMKQESPECFESSRDREIVSPNISSKRVSKRKANRAAPPPPSHGDSRELQPREVAQESVAGDTPKRKGSNAPSRPPQPVLNTKLLPRSMSEDSKQKSNQHKLKIEKVRSGIEESCRMQKELEIAYNNSFDGKERQEIAENKKFVVAKLRRLQAELNNLISGADHIYEPVDNFERTPEAANTTSTSLPRSSSIPLPLTPDEQIEDIKEKRRKKRNHVIQELIQTEADYLLVVAITIEDIMKPLLERELQLDVNIETLFGNIEQIKDFSTRLLASLKKASDDHYSAEDIDVGQVFISHIPEMKEVYMIYCRNHDDASALLERCEEDPEFQVSVNECLNSVKNKVNTFDLGSFLIKPVQRILKYPLLLRELVKLTDVPQARQSTDCYDHIINAVKLIQDVAKDINEDKRRKDLVRKYRKGSQDNTKITGKISRLSLHSVKKKSARISMRIGHATGLNQTETVDEKFNLLVQRFKDLEKAIKTLLVNSDQYGTRCRDLLNLEHLLTEHITDFSASDHTPTIVAYGTAMKRVADHLYRKFHDQTQLRVHTPLSAALVRFKGPQAIIDKRFDKLLDYENCQKNSDSKEKIQMAKNVYEALNQQLLNELPTLCELATKLLEECMALFIRLQIRFQQSMFEVLRPVLEMYRKEIGEVPNEEFDKTKIMEHFNFDHNQVLFSMRDITVIPASFCAITSSPSIQSRSSKSETIRSQASHLSPVTQTQAQQEELLNKYKSGDIFVATSSYSSSDKVDISCSTNDVIVVIKKQDPLGNTAKWFCDNGVGMGFLPSVILQVRQQPDCRTPSPLSRRDKSPTPSSRSSGSVDSFSFSNNPTPKRASLSPSPYSIRQGLYGQVGSPGRAADLSSEQDNIILQEVFQVEEEMLDDTEYGEVSHAGPKERYRVEFNFKARTTLELTVTESELLNLIVPHDLEGNTEWWLMSNSEGKQGYVPANYMNLAEYL